LSIPPALAGAKERVIYYRSGALVNHTLLP